MIASASPLQDRRDRGAIGFNMDCVALHGREDRLREANAVLAAPLQDATIRVLAQQSGLAYVASRLPDHAAGQTKAAGRRRSSFRPGQKGSAKCPVSSICSASAL